MIWIRAEERAGELPCSRKSGTPQRRFGDVAKDEHGDG